VLSIGEFSHTAHVTVKALRHYHEQGILVPELVDGESGYRYYGWKSFERIQAIQALKEMGFSLTEIGALLKNTVSESEIADALTRKLGEIETGIRERRAAQKRIREFLHMQLVEEEQPSSHEEVKEQRIEDILVLGLRVRGRYQEIGLFLSTLCRKAGRYATGGPFCLYYEGEYKEEDADFEVCVPARARVGIEGLDCRTLPGGRAATVIHRGPYSTLSSSYARLFDFMRGKKMSVQLPIREEYLKGPGFIFPGDPERFRTRLITMIGG
jgi:DNA-binding transcriptional MerR regulator